MSRWGTWMWAACLALPLTTANISCLSETGSSVDYLTMMKHNNGGVYDYMDTSSTSFATSSHNMEGTSGALYLTLKQVYDNSADVAFAFYNDESSDGVNHMSRAHSKGVVAFDGTQGFWLIHSVPRFPPTVSEGYTGGLPDYTFGQSFLCITFEASKFEDIATQQQVTHPYVYDSNLPSSLSDDHPTFAAWLGGTKSSEDTGVMTLTSAGRRTFKHFAKSKAWDNDLYEELVAPGLGSDLTVATWQNGASSNVMPSYCAGSKYDFSVQNVANHTAANGDSWSHTADHSKWAVASSSSSPVYYSCIGDINRQYSQRERGGGTMCYSLKSLWTSLNNQIGGVEACS